MKPKTFLISIGLSINVNDTATPTEFVDVDLTGAVIFIDVNDAATPTEAITLIFNSLLIDVNDTTTLSEAIEIALNPLLINVNDTATLSEAIGFGIGGSILIDVNDSIAVSEFINVIIQLKINVNDSIVISEYILIEKLDKIEHSWNIIRVFTEELLHTWIVIPIRLNVTFIHEWDILTSVFRIVHSWRVLPINIQNLFNQNIQTPVIILEYGILKIDIADNVKITESTSIEGLSFGKSVYDEINISESVAVAIPRLINVNDSTLLTEDVEIVIA